MSKSKKIFSDLVKVLDCKHRLGLEEKTDGEIQQMLKQHQSSVYKKIVDFLGIPPSKRYAIKEEVVKGTLDYREILRERSINS